MMDSNTFVASVGIGGRRLRRSIGFDFTIVREADAVAREREALQRLSLIEW